MSSSDTGPMDEHIGGRAYRLTMTVDITIPEDSDYWITEEALVDRMSWEHPRAFSILADITHIEAELTGYMGALSFCCQDCKKEVTNETLHRR